MHAALATAIRIIPHPCKPHHGGIQVNALPPISHYRSTPVIKERGAALIITLLILLIMTLLGITAITTSSLQEKMAGNMRDQYMAQQAGDSIIRDAESWIRNLSTRPIPTCTPSSAERVWDYSCADILNIENQNDAWWAANGYAANVGNTYVNQNPRYVDEHLQRVTISSLGETPVIYRHYYRATGWSVGASDYARGLFQSVFSRRKDEFPNP